MGKDFMTEIPKTMATKAKIDKGIKLNSTASARQKKQSLEWIGNQQNGKKCLQFTHLTKG